MINRIRGDARRPLIDSLVVLCLTVATGGCTSVMPGVRTVGLQDLPKPLALSVTASSSIRERQHWPQDDLGLQRKLETEIRKSLAGARLVRFAEDEDDYSIIFVMVDYVPGCDPNCAKFFTYRNWSCSVLARRGQAFEVEGSTYNPFFSPTSDCVSRFLAFLRETDVIQ